MLLGDAVGPFSTLGLEGLDVVPGLLHRAGHEPADGVFLPAHLVHDLGKRGAVLPLEHSHYLRRLTALPRPGGFLRFRGLLALGRFLGGGGLLGRLGLGGRALGGRCATFGLASSFGLVASPNPCMRSQIGLAAVLALLNVFSGATPGKLFQMATSRSAGQPATSSASSFWLPKLSNGVAFAAAASSGLPCAVMLLSVSIVNVVIIVLLCGATLCVVMTWITPICVKRKAILNKIDEGEGQAMGGRGRSFWQVA